MEQNQNAETGPEKHEHEREGQTTQPAKRQRGLRPDEAMELKVETRRLLWEYRAEAERQSLQVLNERIPTSVAAIQKYMAELDSLDSEDDQQQPLLLTRRAVGILEEANRQLGTLAKWLVLRQRALGLSQDTGDSVLQDLIVMLDAFRTKNELKLDALLGLAESWLRIPKKFGHLPAQTTAVTQAFALLEQIPGLRFRTAHREAIDVVLFNYMHTIDLFEKNDKLVFHPEDSRVNIGLI